MESYDLFICCSVLPIAMDRAIKEIVPSIRQRSVTIATQTTKELVLKVFFLLLYLLAFVIGNIVMEES